LLRDDGIDLHLHTRSPLSAAAWFRVLNEPDLLAVGDYPCPVSAREVSLTAALDAATVEVNPHFEHAGKVTPTLLSGSRFRRIRDGCPRERYKLICCFLDPVVTHF
jgi:hypothetical protein